MNPISNAQKTAGHRLFISGQKLLLLAVLVVAAAGLSGCGKIKGEMEGAVNPFTSGDEGTWNNPVPISLGSYQTGQIGSLENGATGYSYYTFTENSAGIRYIEFTLGTGAFYLDVWNKNNLTAPVTGSTGFAYTNHNWSFYSAVNITYIIEVHNASLSSPVRFRYRVY